MGTGFFFKRPPPPPFELNIDEFQKRLNDYPPPPNNQHQPPPAAKMTPAKKRLVASAGSGTSNNDDDFFYSWFAFAAIISSLVTIAVFVYFPVGPWWVYPVIWLVCHFVLTAGLMGGL